VAATVPTGPFSEKEALQFSLATVGGNRVD